MSFLRHRESYPSDGGVSIEADASAHRSDEFPAGYSLAGCSPAEPASASPTGTSMPRLSAKANYFAANGNPSQFPLSHRTGSVGVKTQNPLNGELSHGVVTQAVHEGV